MRDFFASIRRMIAMDKAFEAAGAVVHDAIKRIIIPNVQKRIDHAKTPEEAKKYQDLIAEYEKYANPISQEGRKFAEKARDISIRYAHKFGKSELDAAEVASDIASEFYINKGWMKSFDEPSFDSLKGPSALQNRWSTMFLNKSGDIFYRLNRTVIHSPNPRSKGEEMSPFENMADPRQEDSLSSYTEILTDLKDYVFSQAKSMGTRGKNMIDVFKIWMGLAIEGQADTISVDRDIMPALAEEYGEEVSRSSAMASYNDMKQLVVRFFEEELDSRVSDRVKRKLRMSSIDVLTYEGFRRKVAAWVLGREI